MLDEAEQKVVSMQTSVNNTPKEYLFDDE